MVLVNILSVIVVGRLQPRCSFLLHVTILLAMLFSTITTFSILSSGVNRDVKSTRVGARNLGLVMGATNMSIIARVTSTMYHSTSRATLTGATRLVKGVAVTNVVLPIVKRVVGLYMDLYKG